jgi:hypothetical protein
MNQPNPNIWPPQPIPVVMVKMREKFAEHPNNPLPLDLPSQCTQTVIQILRDTGFVILGVNVPWSNAADFIKNLKPSSAKCSPDGTMPVNTLMAARKIEGLSNQGRLE